MRAIDVGALRLEPLTAAHAPEMFGVLSDPAIYEFENAPPASEAALARRYAIQERRSSEDGSEVWLNWVVQLPDGTLAGYVQATVLRTGVAFVAYELASRHWRQGIGSTAVAAMLGELAQRYGVETHLAVLKARNHRSQALLRKLGFVVVDAQQCARIGARPESDEIAMCKPAR